MNNGWPVVTRDNPCPKCGKPDRCKLAADGVAGHCFRGGGTWRGSEGQSAHGTSYVGAAHFPKQSAPGKPQRDWKAEIERMRAAITDEAFAALAEQTGVPAAAWALLAPGWATANDLRAFRAGGAGWKENPPDGAYVFAEHDGDGRVVGLSFRTADGRKGSPAGANRGITVPTNLHDLPNPVLIVEGASDVASAAAMGLAAVGRPSNRAGANDLAIMLDGRAVLVVGERDGKPGGAWPGRDGAKAVAGQLAGHWDEPVAWTLPPLGTKDLREWLRGKIAAGCADADGLRSAGVDLLAELKKQAKDAKAQRRSQADVLVDLARQQYRLGLTSDGEPFAVPYAGPNTAVMFRGNGSLRMAMAKAYRQANGKTPTSSALADALLTLEGMADDSEREPVEIRVAQVGESVVLDLCDKTGRAAVVTAVGWTVEPVAPVLFRRTLLTGPLPEPVQTAADIAADALVLAELRGLLNVDDRSWPLVVGYLVAALIPGIPHPVLMLGGEQGTGKSTAARLLVGLFDDSPAPLRSEPREPRQWVISAAGSWAVALDNVSSIPGWLSDAICKAATGDGWIDRKLYTDSDLAVLTFRRCVIITSIDTGAMRGDLGDRAILIDLERIPDTERRTEADLLAAFKEMRPRLIGALLSALSRTLAVLPDVKLDSMPRMADFARVLAAIDRACPALTGGRALELFAGQRERIAGEVVESDEVAAAVARLMESRDEWTGTAGELLKVLTPDQPSTKAWPKNARAVSGRLRRVRPALEAIGIQHTPPKDTDKTRTHRLERTGSQPPEPPAEPPTGGTSPAVQAMEDHGGSGDVFGGPPDDRPPVNVGEALAVAGLGDPGGSGGRSPLLSFDEEDGWERGEV